MQLLNKSKESHKMGNDGNQVTLTKEEFARQSRILADSYHRYHIDAMETPDRQALPNNFIVKVGKIGLAKMITSEIFHYWGKWDVVFSRPCTYGVFSGPIGGFSPRPEMCVGCLRCTVQHPEFVTVLPNPARAALGDSYLSSKLISTIDDEARKGTVPVRGQGYRGRFGGPGWDGMFTDMSEIVRPSRDGIHGRELISTVVDVGSKPMSLKFDSNGELVNEGPKMMSIQVPFVFDSPDGNIMTKKLATIWKTAAEQIDTLAMLPAELVTTNSLASRAVVPILSTNDAANAGSFGNGTRMVELDSWDNAAFETAKASNHDLQIGIRLPFESGWQSKLTEMVQAGVPVIHFVANNHGEDNEGNFIMDLLMEAHNMLLESGTRDKVTFLNSGGIVAADHLPKSIICGLDAVGLDLPLFIAMQARLSGDTASRSGYKLKLPRKCDDKWATQRIVNLSASWRDQLLEILGAMGVREVRRLRGEMGRAMWCAHLEAEAFSEIEGFLGGDE
jgi:hypothetical protein